MEFSSQRRETLLFLITIIYYNLRSGPILAASIHSFLRCRAIIGPLFTFCFPAKISLKKRNKKRAWSQVKLITHSWRKTKKTEPSLTMNLTLTIVHKTKKTNQHRGWAIKPLETFWLSYLRKLTPSNCTRPWLKQPWYIDVVTHFHVIVYRQLFTYESTPNKSAHLWCAYIDAMIRENNLTDLMQGWQHGKGLIYLTQYLGEQN